MNTASRIASALCVVSLFMGEVTYATPEITKADEQEHVDLISLIEAIGIPVSFDGFPCTQGWHGGYALDGSEFVLCENKVATQAERLDTVRHEAWHVYQDIRDCNVKDKTTIQPVFLAGVVTQPYYTMAAKHYEKQYIPAEAEAAWAANTFNAEQINILLYSKAKSCGYKF